ncbi:MAG: hypothetical protein ACI4XQ_00230 [Eubacteriales bacterium]
MKKKILCAVCAVLVLCALCVPAFADEEATVYVTISSGKLELARKPVVLSDADGDGAMTVNDVLILAHNAEFTGGADAGYAFADGDYGLYITKLWGVENGSGYGYYVNNAAAFSLTDAVSAGDSIAAFVYTDTVAFSDTYSFFDKDLISGKAGESVELCLSAAGYDENWAPITLPVEGAVITVDGVDTGVVTDAEGKAVVELSGQGTVVISARSETSVLVPPVCIAELETEEGSGDVSDGAADDAEKDRNLGWVLWVVVGAVVICVAVAVFAFAKRKK